MGRGAYSLPPSYKRCAPLDRLRKLMCDNRTLTPALVEDAMLAKTRAAVLWKHIALAAVAYPAAACAGEPSPVDVHVLPDGENCTVYGQQMRCNSIGTYL